MAEINGLTETNRRFQAASIVRISVSTLLFEHAICNVSGLTSSSDDKKRRVAPLERGWKAPKRPYSGVAGGGRAHRMA